MQSDNLERTAPDDLYYDFCLWPYQPVALPENKFRSSNLLFHSFETAGAPQNAYGVVEAIQNEIGKFNSVWGVKQIDGALRWEFYFYDYRRQQRERSVTRVLRAIKPYIPCTVSVNESFEYFMFSLDITQDFLSGAKKLEEVHMYVGNPGSAVSSGICYSVTAERTRLENFYFFFDAKQQDAIASKIKASAFYDATVVDIHQLLWPEMNGCEVTVVANKQLNDALYFSRINVDQLIFFLRKLKYPVSLVSFVESNRSCLDHLLYDVGYDYRMEGNEIVVLKSGYYGIF